MDKNVLCMDTVYKDWAGENSVQVIYNGNIYHV